MADWSKPLLTSLWEDFLDELDARLDDLAPMLDVTPAPTNLPINSIQLNRTQKKFLRWNGTSFVDDLGQFDIDVSTLGGFAANAYPRLANPNVFTQNQNIQLPGATFVVDATTGQPLFHMRIGGTTRAQIAYISGTGWQLQARNSGGSNVNQFLVAETANDYRTFSNGKFFHEQNMGSGSGLDADTLRTFAPGTSAVVNTLVLRETSGRITVGAATASTHALRKQEFDDHTGTSTAGIHGSTAAATANKLIHRDASGRAKIADPAVAGDIANRGWVESLVDHRSKVTVTSGNAVTIASAIAAGAREIKISLFGIMTDTNASDIFMRMGTASGFETTGYFGTTESPGDGTSHWSSPGGVMFTISKDGTDKRYSGHITLTRLDPATHEWVISVSGGGADDATGTDDSYSGGGRKTLAGELTQLQLLVEDSNNFSGTVGRVGVIIYY
jgi:hypothetical protein